MANANELVQRDSNAFSLSTLSLLEYDNERQLLFEEVTQLNGMMCGLTTSLRTGYKGWNPAAGIMFTVRPSKDIELLTLEIPTFENFGNGDIPAESRKIQVYFRQGDFSGVMNDPSAWTKIADTTAKQVSPLPAPDSSNVGKDTGVIVPAKEFTPTSLKQDEIYSLYISSREPSLNAKETLLKLEPSEGLVGDKSEGNNEIEIRTGVRLKGSSFPTVFKDPADFNGVLHYRVDKSCTDGTLFTTTDISLMFIVNSEPNNQIMGKIRTAIDETLDDWLSQNEALKGFKDKFQLEKEGIGMHFRGRSEEKCPNIFEKCNLVSATVSFKHSLNLDQGMLRMEFLRQHRELDATVISYVSPLEISYAGDPLAKAEFAITLTGTPMGEQMNDVQKRYFEDVTVHFLRKHVESTIFDAVVSHEDAEILFIEDGEKPERRMLRATRSLQDNGGKIKIITEIAAEGSVPELRETVLEGIGSNMEAFTMDLVSHQMRPTEINEKEFGDFFAGLTSSQVKPHIPKTVNIGTGSVHGEDGEIQASPNTAGNKEKIWVIVCILLIVFSFLYICYRIYMDCFYSPFEKPMKLEKKEKKKEKDNGKSKGKKKGKKKGKNKSKNKGKSKSRRSRVDEFKDEMEDSPAPNNGFFLEKLKLPKGFGGSAHSPSTNVSSKADDMMKKRQSSHHKPRSSTNRSASSKSSSRKTSRNAYEDEESKSFADDGDDMSLSSGDEESDDDESVNRSNSLMPAPPKRSPQISDARKERKSPTKSSKTPQSANPRQSSSTPKRGGLKATKSMPLQKRNGSDLKEKKAEKPRSAPRSPSGPRRGKLTATKSMPVEKRERLSLDLKTPKKPERRVSKGETPERSTPHRSASGMPKRGRLTPSKSLPMEKRDVKRTKSMDSSEKKYSMSERKKELESKLSAKKRSPSKDVMPEIPKKRLESRSSHSDPKKLGRRSNHSDSNKLDRKSWHPNSNSLDHSRSHSYSKKIEARSSHSTSKKKKPVERTRGIKPSKSRSMPVKNKSIALESNSRKIWLSDMIHDSTSDSDLSDSSDEGISSSRNSSKSASSSQGRRKMSQSNETPRKSHGRGGGKIQRGGLPDVAE